MTEEAAAESGIQRIELITEIIGPDGKVKSRTVEVQEDPQALRRKRDGDSRR